MLEKNPDKLSATLRNRLRDVLPGHEAHLRMAPLHRRDPDVHGVYGRDCRQAGVIALLDLRRDPSFVLTIRKSDLNTHGGQISFPGGGCELGETHVQAAMRELWEEIGAPPSSYIIAGAMTPLFIPPSNFCVHPYLAVLSEDVEWNVDITEVESVLDGPLSVLMSEDSVKEEVRAIGDLDVKVPYYDVDGNVVWGATAMMLSEAIEVLSELV